GPEKAVDRVQEPAETDSRGAAGAADRVPPYVSRPGCTHDVSNLRRADPRIPGSSGVAQARPAAGDIRGGALGQLRSELPARAADTGSSRSTSRLVARHHQRGDTVAALDDSNPGDPGRLLRAWRALRGSFIR